MDKAGFGAIHYIVKKDSHKNKHGLLERLIINGEADVDLTTTFRDGVTGLHLAVEVDKYLGQINIIHTFVAISM